MSNLPTRKAIPQIYPMEVRIYLLQINKDSIKRRHTDNYGTQAVVADNFKTNLTPWRWNHTGWKYANHKSDYFDHENKIKNMLGTSSHKIEQNRNHPHEYKTHYMRTFKGKTYRDKDRVEKGVLNQANYISECYPVIPLSENSVANFQRKMYEVVNRRKNSVNITGPSSMSPLKPIKCKDERKYHKSRHHRHKHERTEEIHEKSHKIHLREDQSDAFKIKQDKGRNIHHHHKHRRHNSDYYTTKENANMDNGYMNRTHHEFLRKMGPEMDECESPLKIHELLKLSGEDMRKSLRDIKRAKFEKVAENHKHTSSILNKIRSSREYDGNRTFVSDPEIVSTQDRNGKMKITKNNDKVDIANLTLGGIFMSPQQKAKYADAVSWGGNIFVGEKPNGFRKKRTFVTEWESASNNLGVFVNK